MPNAVGIRSSHGVIPASRMRRTVTVSVGKNITIQKSPNSVMVAVKIPDNTGLWALPDKKAIGANMQTNANDIASMAKVHIQNSLRSDLPLKLI